VMLKKLVVLFFFLGNVFAHGTSVCAKIAIAEGS
jgi:hypothetical protein